MMVRQTAQIPWSDYEEAIPAILTFILMPLSFSIATGLACGFLSWTIIKIMMGKFNETHWVMYIIALLSLVSLVI